VNRPTTRNKSFVSKIRFCLFTPRPWQVFVIIWHISKKWHDERHSFITNNILEKWRPYVFRLISVSLLSIVLVRPALWSQLLFETAIRVLSLNLARVFMISLASSCLQFSGVKMRILLTYSTALPRVARWKFQ